MYNNALFRPKNDNVWGYATRLGKKKVYHADEEEDLYLFDCDFTEEGWGISKTSFGIYAWFHKEDLNYISGNIGVRDNG